MDELQERIVELEIRYTHQVNMIEELNAELTAANKRIDHLERKVGNMREMLSGLQPEMMESPDE